MSCTETIGIFVPLYGVYDFEIPFEDVVMIVEKIYRNEGYNKVIDLSEFQIKKNNDRGDSFMDALKECDKFSICTIYNDFLEHNILADFILNYSTISKKKVYYVDKNAIMKNMEE